MEDTKYKDNERVLYKIAGKLSISKKEPQEVNCLVTENNLVIEGQETKKIPLLRIKNHQVNYESYETPPQTVTAEERLGSVTLTYLDELNQKQRFSFKSNASIAVLFNRALSSAISNARVRWLESVPVEQRCAGFWRRFAAYLLDGLILNVISWRFFFILSFLPYMLGYVIGLAFFIGGIIYFPAFWVWQGATPGKMMMGIKIVKCDGNPIGVGRAILRYFGYILSAIILYIGYIMIAWDRRKQGLHDKIAGTCVVRVS